MNRHGEEARTGRGTRYLTESVNGRLVISLRDVSHTMRSLYEGRGSQKRVLIVLSETGTITQRELTRRLCIQPGSASEVIAKLEQAGLVARSLSEADRRTADISLTEEGARQARAALEQRRQRYEEMFSALTEEEKGQLLSLLEKLNGDWARRYPEAPCHGDCSHHERCHGGPRGRGGGCGPDGGQGRGRDREHCAHPSGQGGRE